MARRILTLILLVAALCFGPATTTAQAPAPVPQNQEKEQTVYITKTGKKYHTTAPLAGIFRGAKSPPQ